MALSWPLVVGGLSAFALLLPALPQEVSQIHSKKEQERLALETLCRLCPILLFFFHWLRTQGNAHAWQLQTTALANTAPPPLPSPSLLLQMPLMPLLLAVRSTDRLMFELQSLVPNWLLNDLVPLRFMMYSQCADETPERLTSGKSFAHASLQSTTCGPLIAHATLRLFYKRFSVQNRQHSSRRHATPSTELIETDEVCSHLHRLGRSVGTVLDAVYLALAWLF